MRNAALCQRAGRLCRDEISQKEPPINNDADVFESHFGRKAEKSGTVCRESFAGEFEELDEILSDIWLVFNDD